ncbi:oxidoreductase [Planctomyces sp. SCGC AG-212-M04]|nr:oxidoreductase [Planctomyces sp. SCGC AG-212-M04]
MNLELEKHVAVITGGASGIGLATARAFAVEGARVVLWDRSETTPDVASRLAKETGADATGLAVDITSDPSVQEAAAWTRRDAGGIDHVVHAAAIGSGRFGFPFTNLTPDDWRQVLEVNVMGTTNVAHAVTPALVERRGTMVIIASVAGQIGSQTDPPYSASKAANINFAQCMAKDLAPQGVRVNVVCPGMVQTPLNRGVWQAWHDQTPEAERLSYEEWAGRKIKAIVPLGEWQTPEAIADMIVFLSSARARHVTGQTINVDGGFVMHW